MKTTIPINPCPKPRMTRRDKWANRACVTKYFGWKDEIKAVIAGLPDSFRVTFVVPIPKSYSKKKRKELNGQPHQVRPDLDNFLKALLDALLDEDGHVWRVDAQKIWGDTGAIIIDVLDNCEKGA